MEDVFCSREELLPTVFYETERFMFVYDKYPIITGHMLIIPKRHIEDMIELDASEWKDLEQLKNSALPKALGRYCKDGISYNVAIQIGEHSGREINHLHIHILPRTAEDSFKEDSQQVYMNIANRKLRDGSSVAEEVKELRKLFKYKPE